MINEIITKKFDDPQDYIEFSHIQDDIHADVLKTGSPGYLLFLEYKDPNYKKIESTDKIVNHVKSFYQEDYKLWYNSLNK